MPANSESVSDSFCEGLKFGKIFSAQSDAFHGMFESNMRESSDGVVKLEDTNPEAVQAMLKYLYERDLTSIDGDLILSLDLLRLGNKYNIEGLQEACEKVITRRAGKDVDMRTALHVFLLGYQLDVPELAEFAARLLKS